MAAQLGGCRRGSSTGFDSLESGPRSGYRRGVTRVFVARDDALGVVSFYSLSAFAIAADSLPEELTKKLPRYDEVPAALIGRLARDTQKTPKGFGEVLMTDAIERVSDTGERLGIYAIVVDAKNEKVAEYYRGLGFQPFPSRPLRLFVPVATALKAAVAASR